MISQKPHQSHVSIGDQSQGENSQVAQSDQSDENAAQEQRKASSCTSYIKSKAPRSQDKSNIYARYTQANDKKCEKTIQHRTILAPSEDSGSPIGSSQRQSDVFPSIKISHALNLEVPSAIHGNGEGKSV